MSDAIVEAAGVLGSATILSLPAIHMLRAVLRTYAEAPVSSQGNFSIHQSLFLLQATEASALLRTQFYHVEVALKALHLQGNMKEISAPSSVDVEIFLRLIDNLIKKAEWLDHIMSTADC